MFGGMFGGNKTTTADPKDKKADAPLTAANCKIATGEKERLTVTIDRPMGMVLEPLDEKGKGAIVTELVDGGNADRSGMIQACDILVAVSFAGGETQSLENRWYESILDELAGEPDCPNVTLTLERAVLEDDEDMLTITADAKRYWEEKRELKARGGPKVLRRTPGVEPKDIKVLPGPLGSGNFGTVFRGVFKGDQDVVLKNAKVDVMAAEELLECEMDINYHVHANAKGACARFMGCIELGANDGGGFSNGTLTEGLWLMWANEGENTVEALMRRGTAPLAAAMACADATELGVTKKAMGELLASLARLHECGVVHRDVKPANLIAAEKDGGVLKLIDLGAAALCLPMPETLNYYPGDGPADPRYAKADELYLLPPGSPRPTADNAAKLWEAHKPDRFDSWSAGCTMLQLAVIGLRTDAGLERFLADYASVGYDVDAFRGEKMGEYGGFADFAALDANGGAGWDLCQRLMEAERDARVSCEAALSHAFFD